MGESQHSNAMPEIPPVEELTIDMNVFLDSRALVDANADWHAPEDPKLKNHQVRSHTVPLSHESWVVLSQIRETGSEVIVGCEIQKFSHDIFELHAKWRPGAKQKDKPEGVEVAAELLREAIEAGSISGQDWLRKISESEG